MVAVGQDSDGVGDVVWGFAVETKYNICGLV